jgi:hypothetical protein
MGEALEAWLENHARREDAHSHQGLQTAKLVTTFSAAIAATFVATYLAEGPEPSGWDEGAVVAMALSVLGVLVIVFRARKAPDVKRRVEIFLGVLVLAIAALMAVRFVTRRRARGAETTTAVADSDASSPISRLLKRGQDAPAEGASATQRLLRRAHSAWESGALWVAFVIGFWAGPNPSLVMFSLATILASGAVIGAQIGAAVVFVVVSLAVVEIVLISNLLAPTKTQAALRLVHDWVGGYRTPILVAILTLVGFAFVAQGTGIL